MIGDSLFTNTKFVALIVKLWVKDWSCCIKYHKIHFTLIQSYCPLRHWIVSSLDPFRFECVSDAAHVANISAIAFDISDFFIYRIDAKLITVTNHESYCSTFHLPLQYEVFPMWRSPM